VTERERWRRTGRWLLRMVVGNGVGIGFFVLGRVLHGGGSEFFGGLGALIITVVSGVGCFFSCWWTWQELRERWK
jgi:flagellar motor component MotA